MTIFVEIPRKRLAELERIERAHFAYMGAMRVMRQEQYRQGNPSADWRDGFKGALARFAELIVEEGRNA